MNPSVEINEGHSNKGKKDYLFRHYYSKGRPASLVFGRDTKTGRRGESFIVE
jgi:hypothetical protein